MNTSYRIELDVYGTETEIVSSVKIKFYASEEGRKKRSSHDVSLHGKVLSTKMSSRNFNYVFMLSSSRGKKNRKYHFC